MLEIVKRAERVNGRNSTKEDFRRYCALKTRAVFQEDVFVHAGCVMTETTVRQLHPLLFTKVSEVIDTTSRSLYDTKLTAKFEEKYPELMGERLGDNKPFADGEVFADRFTVMEKDIYYGYAIAGHKSQGSTYDVVYVDENDFKKISDRWNFRIGANEQRHRERNQLRYVAYTRASERLHIVHDEERT